jgi:hypothetical protein
MGAVFVLIRKHLIRSITCLRMALNEPVAAVQLYAR